MLLNRQTFALCAGLLLATGCVHDAKRPATGPQPQAHNTNDPIPEEPQDRDAGVDTD